MSESRNSQDGFTLIELLVVLAILGILAAIGVSQFAGYKQRAVDGAMQADLHAARNAMEAYYEQNDFTYNGATPALLVANHGFRSSDGVTLNVVSTTPTDFELRACANGGTSPAFRFTTQVGRAEPVDAACS